MKSKGTIRFELRKDSFDKNGKCHIRLVYQVKGNRRYFSTGCKVIIPNWDFRNQRVIYIDKIKYSVEHNFLKPDFFSLIPKLAVNSPKIIRSSSGFDAIAQASESIFSKKANIRSLKYSSKSLGYSIKSFIGFVNNPNLNNATQMLRAANFSGKAINIARTNAPHALSYSFASKFRIPHGIAVSIFFI